MEAGGAAHIGGMTLLLVAPSKTPSTTTDFLAMPVGEALLLDAAGVPVTTIPDAWGAGELDHQQDFEDMVEVFGWPDLDELPDGPFDYPAY